MRTEKTDEQNASQETDDVKVRVNSHFLLPGNLAAMFLFAIKCVSKAVQLSFYLACNISLLLFIISCFFHLLCLHKD